MKTKFLTLCLALFAATNLFAVEIDGICYKLFTDLTAIVVPSEYEYYSGDINIPSTITYNSETYTVTTIADRAFKGCSGLTSVTIPSSVTTIGERAFDGCSGLTSVTIGNSVTTIRNYAFYNCSGLTKTNYIGTIAQWCKISFDGSYANPLSYAHNLYLNNQLVTDLVIPEGVDTIGDYAFYGCSGLTSITIPNSVTTIGDYAFEDCTGLTSVTIGNSVTTIGDYAFYGCSGLTSITIPNSVTTIGDYAFYGCSGLTSVTIPNSVTTIGNYVFSRCSGLTSIIIPNSVTTIRSYAFGYCSCLTSITIPNSVTTIGDHAFYKCSGLTSVTIGNSVTTIGVDAFTDCSGLTSVTAPAIYFDIRENMWLYHSKQLTSVVVNGGELTENELLYINRSYKTLKTLDVSAVTNTEFADEAFKGYYNLESLALPQSLERVSYMMVAGCKNLKSIDIPASVTEIDQSAFEDCRSIQTITFGGVQPASAPSMTTSFTASASQLKKIGNWAFYNAHELQDLALPEGVEEIGEGAFYGCVYMEDLLLPRSTKSIGDNTFALCSKLNKITVYSPVPPTIAPKTFYDVKRQIPVYVPIEVVDAYKQSEYWKEFNIIGVDMPTGFEPVHGSQPTPKGLMHKVLRNGQIMLERNNATYTLMGQKVR